MDLIYVAVALGFFALSLGYTSWLERLLDRRDPR